MELEFRLQLPVAREPLFVFHTDPDNLSVLIEGWEATTVLSHDGHTRPGARLHLLERVGPLRFRFVFEQFLLEPPERFGERMVAGFFRRFEHVHEFEPVAADPAATTLRDRLWIELPWWMGGELAMRWFVAPRIRRFFDHRRRSYERLAAEGRFSA